MISFWFSQRPHCKELFLYHGTNYSVSLVINAEGPSCLWMSWRLRASYGGSTEVQPQPIVGRLSGDQVVTEMQFLNNKKKSPCLYSVSRLLNTSRPNKIHPWDGSNSRKVHLMLSIVHTGAAPLSVLPALTPTDSSSSSALS